MEIAPTAPVASRGGFRAPSLYLQVLLAITLGVWLGSEHPDLAVQLKPLGDYFVKLIKLLIAPIVFCTVSHGIAGMGDLKRAGRVGVKAVLYFELMTTVALALGLLIVRTLKPGADLHAVPDAADTAQLNKTLAAAPPKDALTAALDWVLNVVTGQNVIPVLLLALTAGVLLAAMPKRAEPWVHRIDDASKVLFKLVRFVMWLAPIGALGAMAYTVGKFGLASLANLAKLMGSFYATALLFVLVVLGLVMRAMGLRISRLLYYLRDELALVLGTSSSEAALPRLMQKLEAAGCKGEVVRMVVPTGYSFNLDGTCIYLTMAAIFVAQATDSPISLGDELKLLAVLLVTSKGAAGVTGSGFIVLAATLSTSGVIPVSGLALLLGVDRFMSEARALTNMVGNAVATLVVSRWEKAVDVEVAKEVVGPVGVARARQSES
ncbi:MAG: C4-dicarboxylate transporter DctA [Myxococcaceae bacterium]